MKKKLKTPTGISLCLKCSKKDDCHRRRRNPGMTTYCNLFEEEVKE